MVLEQFDPKESKCQKWSKISRWKGEMATSFFQVIQFLANGWIISQCCFYHHPLKEWMTYYHFRGEARVQRPSFRFLVLRLSAFYNSGMGGVDLTSQGTIAYRLDRRLFVRFYLRIFFDFSDVGYVNSYLVYNIKHPDKLFLLDFQNSLPWRPEKGSTSVETVKEEEPTWIDW